MIAGSDAVPMLYTPTWHGANHNPLLKPNPPDWLVCRKPVLGVSTRIPRTTDVVRSWANVHAEGRDATMFATYRMVPVLRLLLGWGASWGTKVDDICSIGRTVFHYGRYNGLNTYFLGHGCD